MLHAVNIHAGHGGAGQRIDQHAAQSIAQRMAKAALKRLDHELAIGIVRGHFDAFDARLFEFDDHYRLPSYRIPSVEGIPCSGDH